MLKPQRNFEIAIGFLLRAIFGAATVADGLLCTATGPASLSVVVAPGSIIFNTTVDTLVTGFGSLPVDNTNTISKIGINLASTTIGPMTAPGTPGQSQNYLIQASFSEVDGTPVVLPYYNAANPSVPYSGPSNTGAAQNTLRSQTVNLQLKSGAPATTGSQTTPSPDAGNVGLWVITIANGQSTITAGNIVRYPIAPFIPAKMGVGSLFGFGNVQYFTSSGTFTVPNGVTRVQLQLWGGGGGGGGALNGAAAGGGGGGYTEGIFTVTPGQAIVATIGAGGAAGNGTPTAGGTGGSSVFTGFLSATGGLGGGGASSGVTVPVVGGNGSGGQLNVGGTSSGGGISLGGGVFLAGNGGGSYHTSNSSTTSSGASACYPGGGGGGGAIGSGGANGAAGAAGLCIVRW